MRKHSIKRRKRLIVYLSLATTALLMAFVGILAVDVTSEAVGSDGTFLNSNERDLWSAVSVMVDGVEATRGSWLASHVESKELPSPFVSIVAIAYKFVKTAFHFSLAKEPVETTRLILAIVNLPLLAIFFAATIGCTEKVGSTNWSRYSSAAIVCFATMMLPLTASLNFLIPAATATAVTLWLYIYMADRSDNSYVLSPRWWTAAGFTAALAGAFHASAAIMIVPWLVLFGRLDLEEIKPFLGGVALALVFLGCSLAIGLNKDAQKADKATGAVVDEIVAGDAPEHLGDGITTSSDLPRNAMSYAFHAIVGHHGLFSLTPIWLLLPLAFVRGIQLEPTDFQRLTVAVFLVSLVCALLALGISYDGGEGTQIYLSQLAWMTPLWLLMLTPKIEELEGSLNGKGVVIALAAVGVFSALLAFPSLSQSPWLVSVWPL